MTTLFGRPGVRVALRVMLLAAPLFLLAGTPASAAPPPTDPPAPPPAGLQLGLNTARQPVLGPGGVPVSVLDPGAPLSKPAADAVVPTTAPAAPAPVIPPPCLTGLQTGPFTLGQGCDSVGAAVVGAATAAVAFAEDPLGWLTDKMAQGASGTMAWVADTANNATSADLTTDWWISAYKQAFAIAIILFGILTLWNMVELGRGKIGPEEFGESVTLRSWGFFGGVIFGPPLAKFMIEGAGILTRNIVAVMPGYNGGHMDAATINQSITGAGAGKVIGGAFIAFMLLLLVLISVLFLFLSLAVQTVAVYLAGAVFPIAFTWIITVKHRGGSMKIPFLILGIIFARPLLFFIVGLGMAMSRAAVLQGTDDGARNLANVIMAGVVLSIAAFAPLLLLKFAPVIPTGTSGGIGHGSAVSNPGVAQPGGMTKLQGLAGRSRSGGGKAGGTPTGGRGSTGRGTGGGTAGPGVGTPVHPGAAQAGANQSGTSQAGSKKRGVGANKPAQTGGAPSAAAAALIGATSGGATRTIDPAAAPKKPGMGARAKGAAAAVRNAPAAAVGAAKRAPAAAGRAAKATPAAAGKVAKAAPRAAWAGTKAAGRGAKKAAPVAGSVGKGAAASARRVGSGLANGVSGDDKW